MISRFKFATVSSWIKSIRTLLVVLVEWALAAIVLIRLDLLNAATHRVFLLVGPCFLINHLLPRQFRLGWFITVCVIGAMLVLGGESGGGWDFWSAFSRTVTLFSAGALLAGICFLRVSFAARVALLCLSAILIGLLRTNALGPDALLVVWPILASMFMFRIIVFLHDVSVARSRPSSGMTAAYFSMFPNLTAPLFPIVDFSVMAKSYYSSEAVKIYARGARWILRGVLQLVAFRFVQQLVSIDPDLVRDGKDVFLYLAGSTFVYLQVSGLFHLLIGVLLLFGFNLPETNRRYFFATSFTDYWRRVNIYWKDFILKIFYYPMYFRVKHWGTTAALVVATLWSFFITWALHLYQTWWLKGQVAIGWPDTLFWSILAVLVLINSLVELRKGRERKLQGSTYSPRQVVRMVCATGGTFLVVSVLWSLWNAPDLATWHGVWKQADATTFLWMAMLLASVMLGKLLVELLPQTSYWQSITGRIKGFPYVILRPELALASMACLVLFMSLGRVQVRIPSEFMAIAQPWVDALETTDTMTDAMSDRNRGYYQALNARDEANEQLWEVFTLREGVPSYDGINPVTPTDRYRFQILLPNVDVETYDTRIVTNSFGMRDDEYPLEKPDGVIRIALLGSSNTMGWGVLKEQTFEALLESRLNGARRTRQAGVRYEVLNFANGGWSPLSQVSELRHRALKFSPDIVLFIAHAIDEEWTEGNFVNSIRRKIPINDAVLQEVAEAARITFRTAPELAAERIDSGRLVKRVYTMLVDLSRAGGAVPMAATVLVNFDLLKDKKGFDESRLSLVKKRLEESGFEVLDLSRIYGDLKPWDVLFEDSESHHTNPLGHSMIAEALFDKLMASRQFVEVRDRFSRKESARQLDSGARKKENRRSRE